MKRKRSLIVVLVALFMSLVLCGCEFGSNVEDLYTLPKMPEEYTGLNQLLDELRTQGYEYTVPMSGQYLQSVHMVDLDGDRTVEAIAFFRKNNDEKPMKIFVYKAVEGSYELLCSVEGGGSSIDSVRYEDLNGDEQLELIVGWKMAADVQTLAVYSIRREALPLMSSSYSRYTIEDIDNDGLTELFVLRGDSSVPTMEIYTWQTNILAVGYHCTLSSSMTELSRGSIVNGTTMEGRKAVFVTGVTEQNKAVTDVLVWQSDFAGNGSVVNAAVNDSTGRSALVQPYRQLLPDDINNDGITELPAPESSSSQNDTLVYWCQCSTTGYTYVISQTYHSQSNGWYFVLPDDWWDRVTITEQETMAGENQVILSVDNYPVVAIYTLTGENRESRANLSGRFLIRRQTGVIYAAELLEGSVMYEMDQAQLRNNFNLTVSEWLPNGSW